METEIKKYCRSKSLACIVQLNKKDARKKAVCFRDVGFSDTQI